MRTTTAAVGVAVALGAWTLAGDASALLLEQAPIDGTEAVDGSDVEMTYHYPYPTTLTYVDPGYAFDDDLLQAFAPEPYQMPVIVERRAIRSAMVSPRTSFVEEMYDSADVL